MFEIKIDNAKYWRDCVEAIVSLVDEGTFNITKEGIALKAMDPSGISMVSFSVLSAPTMRFASAAAYLSIKERLSSALISILA